MNPKIWISTAVNTMDTLSLCNPPIRSTLNDSLIRRRCAMDTRLPNTANKKAARVIKPSPPMNMRNKITDCPNNVQCVPVSTSVSPVTVTADVAVNRAVSGSPKFPEVCDIGNARSIVPMLINIMNIASKIMGEEKVIEVKIHCSTVNEFLAISASRGFLSVMFPGRLLGILVFMNWACLLHEGVHISEEESSIDLGN